MAGATSTPVAAATPGVPSRLARAIDRCLLKPPDQRFQKAEELTDALTQSLEARRDIPVPIRVLFKQRREHGRTLGVYPVLALMVAPGFIGSLFVSAIPIGVAIVDLMVIALALGLPLGSVTVWFRRVLRAGYARDDVILAWSNELDRELEERTFAHGERPSRFERAMPWMAGGSLVGVLFSGVAWLLAPAASLGRLVGTLALWLVTATGAGTLAFLRYERRNDLVGRWIGKLLDSRLGTWLFKLAGLGLKGVQPTVQATHRPTELAIGMAVDSLFQSLPKSTQQRLGDLPATVRGLENDATRIRRRIEELNDLLAQIERGGASAARVGDDLDGRRQALDADLKPGRDAAQQRLSAAVAALEAVRLNPLRLCAGAGSVDSLTADLAAAREVGEEVERLLAGHAEVATLLAHPPP